MTEVGIVLDSYPVPGVNKNDDSRNDCYQHCEDQQGSMKLSNIKKTTTYVQFNLLKLYACHLFQRCGIFIPALTSCMV